MNVYVVGPKSKVSCVYFVVENDSIRFDSIRLIECLILSRYGTILYTYDTISSSRYLSRFHYYSNNKPSS